MWQSASALTTSNFPRKTSLNVATPVATPVSSLSPGTSSPVPVTPSPPSKRLVFGLSYLAGISDVTFLRLYSTFPTMMTGNTMKLTEAILSTRYSDAAFYITCITTYILGTVAFKLASKLESNAFADPNSFRTRYLSSTPRTLSLPILLSFICSTFFGQYIGSPSMYFLSFSFGIINAVSIESAGTITCMLTGHMHKLSNTAVEGKGFKQVEKRSVNVLSGFVAGVLSAALIIKWRPAALQKAVIRMLGVGYFVLLGLLDDGGRVDKGWFRRGEECIIDAEEAGCVVEE
ncbi:hypothetical protein TrST_g664 [Triparma strigata]|uniref:DUF1275 domain-containing protein n=1 Tax=Triparma strigata TaxID=1606541 RepID=A0A9W7AVW5_9STRA|nr:hypothetical protein TrST_g664 [Triparma strigata]